MAQLSGSHWSRAAPAINRLALIRSGSTTLQLSQQWLWDCDTSPELGGVTQAACTNSKPLLNPSATAKNRSCPNPRDFLRLSRIKASPRAHMTTG